MQLPGEHLCFGHAIGAAMSAPYFTAGSKPTLGAKWALASLVQIFRLEPGRIHGEDELGSEGVNKSGWAFHEILKMAVYGPDRKRYH